MIAKKELYQQLMSHKEREMYSRISLLDWKMENEIKNIEGRVIDGSITIDGNSPVRRTCNLSIIADDNITEGREKISDLITINKKVKIYIGLKNTTTYENLGEVIWFNMGVYILTDVTYMHDLANATINLTALDKMCLWSGDISGEFQQASAFDYEERIGADGKPYKYYLTYYDIIYGAAVTYGGQDPGKVIINDVDQEIRRVVRKKTPGDMYFSKKDNAFVPSLEGQNIQEITAITQNDYLYVYEPFRPSAEEPIIMNAGQTITNLLDTIKNTLGNYEYFFDIEGNFVFQEIRNFQNTSFTTSITDAIQNQALYEATDSDYDDIIKPIQQINEVDYITDFSKTPYTYSFEETEVASAFTNTPDWRGIKNNFIVYGERGKMLHLAIDKKPIPPNIWYVDGEEGKEIILPPEYYVGIRNEFGLWGIHVNLDMELVVTNLTESTEVPQYIFEEYFTLQDHLTGDWSKVMITEEGKIRFRDEFLPPAGGYYNGAVLKSQFGCECLLYSYDGFPKIMYPFRHLHFLQSPNKTVYMLYANGADRIIVEDANEKFFTDVFDSTGTPPPDYIPKTEFLMLDSAGSSRLLKIDDNGRLFLEDTVQVGVQDNFFIPTIRGGGVNITVYKDRLQFEKTYTRAIPYKQPWQQYIIDLGDEIIKSTPGASNSMLPQWYVELKKYFPMIYKRNDNYYGGSWLKAYSPSGEPIYDGLGDSSIWPYYFDMIDENSQMGKYSISNIGMRTKAVTDEDIKMLYPPVRRNYILVKPSETENLEYMDWLNIKEQPYLILKEDSDYLKHFEYAAYGKDAFTKARELLYLHTSLNETVNITSMPLYFLEPNTKVIAKDEETHTNGDYVIITMAIPLKFDAQQTLTCIKLGSRL